MIVVVGLGNPGKTYEGTRHNIGFEVVDEIAARWSLGWKKSLSFKGMIAEKEGRFLLKPTTYMNLSGEAVAALLHFYKIDPSSLLVVVDDVALPFGQLRLRGEGSSGGHNGLKSIEAHLGTQHFARLRVGVGGPEGDLASYVLDPFSGEEKEAVPRIRERAASAVELWIQQGLTSAMNTINRSSDPSIGEKNGQKETDRPL